MHIEEFEWPEPQSPRDIRPWETLRDILPADLFMYQQAAREIADSLKWSDLKLEALLARMAEAINSKKLPTMSRKDETRLEKTQAPEFLGLVSVDDVNKWLETIGAKYRWNRKMQGAANKGISTEQRQADRWKACLDAGLDMPSDTYKSYPRGISKVAESMGITRQALTEDLDKYRNRVLAANGR